MDPKAVLSARLTSAEAVARYEQMQQRIRAQLDKELGPFPWKVVIEGTDAGCGRAFPQELGGIVVYLPSWGFDANIPDDEWPRAKQIVTTIAAQYGFAAPTLQIDKPGKHTTTGADTALGAQYDFGTQVATTLQVTTGCHLPTKTS